MGKSLVATIVCIVLIGGCTNMSDNVNGNKSTANVAQKANPVEADANLAATQRNNTAGLEKATFGSGCFWCTEAVFQQLKGVRKVVSGYSGGHVKNPTYEEVCGKRTGHAEVIQIDYDPKAITYDELLDAFWHSHDPTTPNRQGNDSGPQYRSVVYFHNDEQKRKAEALKTQLTDSNEFGAPVVTEIAAFTEFYPAEAYHQNYYNENPQNPYCAYVIKPKLDKVKKTMGDKLKTPSK